VGASAVAVRELGGESVSYTDEQKKRLLDLVDKWRRKLNLQHWNIKVDWDSSAHGDNILEVTTWEQRQGATIRVGGFFDCGESAQENAVCHELLHALMQPLWDHIETILDELGGQAHNVIREMLRQDDERLTDTLATILAPIQ
jgi:hypothetical protein